MNQVFATILKLPNGITAPLRRHFAMGAGSMKCG
jgi:hypothetical protein